MQTFKFILPTALAASGTQLVGYPTGVNLSQFQAGGGNHKLTAGMIEYSVQKGDFSVSFAYNGATITWGAGRPTLASGTELNIQLDDAYDSRLNPAIAGVSLLHLLRLDLGTPIAASTTNLISAATSTELPNAGSKTYTRANIGTSPADGANTTWRLDVPRTLLVTATHASSVVATTVTVTGRSMFGTVMTEDLTIVATGTSQTAQGVKAFYDIDSIKITSAGDSTTNTISVGASGAIGLPEFLAGTAFVLKELVNGAAAANAGTFTAGVVSPPTATTGDIRGLYIPDSGVAFNGQRAFQLFVLVEDVNYRGVGQA